MKVARPAAAVPGAASPGFVALYGMEWGVISNGSHVNIIGAGHLLGWERDDIGEPLADVFTPKTDYAALNALLVSFANVESKRSVGGLYEGVPGRNVTVTELARMADAVFTPGAGDHFYYAKITQEDGNVLWSAPVWVSQQEAGAPLD